MKKKILAILLVFCLFFSLVPMAFAADSSLLIKGNTIEVDIPVIDESELALMTTSDTDTFSAKAGVDWTDLGMAVARSGNTERCHLYWTWKGSMLINSIAAQEFVVSNTSSLNPKQYYHYIRLADPQIKQWDVVAATSGMRTISTNLSIPTSETHVKMKITNPMVYYVTGARWVSAVPLNQQAVIN